ncbi:MAG: putative DNA-binding domain-containing protein [Cyanobacteria bacterium TGS_CYA1]|nr:putative DNA-binding domain-containing protein [Cyanobacteria bacterium TGS_CYA1]
MILREIEDNLQTLWTNKKSREEFLAGKLQLFKNSQEPDPKAISLYAELMMIGQMNLMESIYPACQRIIPDFESHVYKYMEECPPNHFNLNRAARGFSTYLSNNCPSLLKKYPFLPELADYEWVELEVMEADVEWPLHEPVVLNDPALFSVYKPVLNPTMQLRNYKYPISEIVDKLIDSSDTESDSNSDKETQKLVKSVKKKAVTLAIFREPESHGVKFLELGEITRFAIEQILANAPTYQELLVSTIQAFSKRKPDQIVIELLDIFPKLEEHRLILGSIR